MKIEVLKTEEILDSKRLKVKVFFFLIRGDEESNTSKLKKG